MAHGAESDRCNSTLRSLLTGHDTTNQPTATLTSHLPSGLRLLFSGCGPVLSHLDLSSISGETLNGEDVLLHATVRCQSLRHVDASWTSAADRGVAALAWACPALRHLDVTGCQGVTDAGVVAVVEALGGTAGPLRHLEISGCVSVTPSGFASIVAGCKANLVHLGIGGIFRLSNALLLAEVSARRG
jgi:EIN3-binding F-box protein